MHTLYYFGIVNPDSVSCWLGEHIDDIEFFLEYFLRRENKVVIDFDQNILSKYPDLENPSYVIDSALNNIERKTGWKWLVVKVGCTTYEVRRWEEPPRPF